MSSQSETRSSSNIKSKRELKKRKKIPKFIRQESWRYVKLRKLSWRSPKGIDNKIRLKVKGWPPGAEVGYRSNRLTRGLHPSGLIPVIVYSPRQLNKLKTKDNIILIISAKVGARLKRTITEEARSQGLRVANPYIVVTSEGVGG